MAVPRTKYPGLGLPIRHWPQADLGEPPASFPLGSHYNIPGADSVLLPVREVAMMAIMDRLTDTPEWHRKVFDEAIVEKWKGEVLAVPDEEWMRIAATPGSEWRLWLEDAEGEGPGGMGRQRPTSVKGIMSEGAFDYCILELRSKARYYEETGLVPTLDASASVVKSDVLVKSELQDSLKRAFQELQDDQAGNPDWHPNSGDMVQDLVHPSLYPLVYGRSKVLPDEVVGVSAAIEKWAGKGEVIETEEERNPGSTGRYVALGSYDVPHSYWSSIYAWLPSNVSFQDDGGVKLTSYINNLHPTKYPEIYATIEKLIETALPAWDQCLLEYKDYVHQGPGRKGSRFTDYSNADDVDMANWDPSDPAELADVEVDFSEDTRWYYLEDEEERKWKILRTPVLREPDCYAEAEYSPRQAVDGLENPDAQALKGRLRRQFQDSGLQVFVKMASIELTPEKPEFPVGGWHIEGQLNERICATALYYLDSENITDSSLSFRMQTSDEQDGLQAAVGQDSYHWMECVFGTNLTPGACGSCLQNYGSVRTPEGRLLAFPNVFQHRVSPFKLTDPTRPGHRRFIALWLVDPHHRIISTANVPPQQQDWWVESVFGRSADKRRAAAEKVPGEVMQLLLEKGVALAGSGSGSSSEGAATRGTLPPELMDMVRGDFSLSTMSVQEARDHRLQLMAERTAQQGTAAENWTSASYGFCEH